MVDPKEHWTTKAEELKKQGKFEEAVEILTKVQEIEKEEKSDDYWYKKAIHSCELGEYEQAIEELKKDTEINKSNFENLFLLGRIYCELKKFEESLEFYNKASEERNSQHLRNTHKIDVMKNINKYEEAVKYSDKIVAETDLDYKYWYHKGITLLKLKKYDEASSCFKISLETNQDNPLILYQFAKAELMKGNNKQALQILEKTSEIDPSIKDKLRNDEIFDSVYNEKQFRRIIGWLEF